MADGEHGPATWAQIGGSLIGAGALAFVIGGLEVANQEKVRPFHNGWIRAGFALAAIGAVIVLGAGVSAGKSWRRSGLREGSEPQRSGAPKPAWNLFGRASPWVEGPPPPLPRGLMLYAQGVYSRRPANPNSALLPGRSLTPNFERDLFIETGCRPHAVRFWPVEDREMWVPARPAYPYREVRATSDRLPFSVWARRRWSPFGKKILTVTRFTNDGFGLIEHVHTPQGSWGELWFVWECARDA